MASRMSPQKDKQVFRRTAKSTKLMNIKPKIMRGGIRL